MYIRVYTYIYVHIYCIHIYVHIIYLYKFTTECEFKVQYNNHKNSFTYCVDEKAAELSNTFAT